MYSEVVVEMKRADRPELDVHFEGVSLPQNKIGNLTKGLTREGHAQPMKWPPSPQVSAIPVNRLSRRRTQTMFL